jgi:hypothetical protein
LEGTQWFIYNVKDPDFHQGHDANENSLSFRMEYNGFIYSGAGDEGVRSQERFLRDHPESLKAHVRNTAHHMWGPVSRGFLEATDAHLYIVSCYSEVRSESDAFQNEFLGAMETLDKNGGRENKYVITGEVGNIYIRAGGAEDWDHAFYSDSKTHVIPGFCHESPRESGTPNKIPKNKEG